MLSLTCFLWYFSGLGNWPDKDTLLWSGCLAFDAVLSVFLIAAYSFVALWYTALMMPSLGYFALIGAAHLYISRRK